MKKLFLFITLLATFVACSKSEDGAENNNPNNNQGGNIPSSIEVESTDWVIAESGGYYYLDFYTSDNWKAFLVNNSDWLSVVSDHGEAGNNKLKILVKENNGEDERRSAIKIVSNTESVTINVTQKMKDALTVTKSKFEVKAEGGNIEVEIKANVEYDFSISESAKSWITHKSTRAMETSTLEFSVAANEDTKRREGQITIYSGNLKETITIYQEGLIKPSIVLTQSEYNVSDEENTISIEVTSGVDVHYEIIDDVDWVREITSRAISTTTFKFEIAQNNGYDSRSARIRFYNEGENLEEYVTINQMQKDAIVLAKDSYTITSDGGEIEVGIGHNVDFDVEIGCVWITRRDTRAFVTDKLTFVIDENNDYDDREGTIIFNSKDGTLSQTVKVYQTQRDAIVLAKESYTIASDGGEIEVGVGHNVDFDVEIGCDWITQTSTRALENETLMFTIAANSSTDDREGTIKFKSQDERITQRVSIYQSGKNALEVSQNDIIINDQAQTIEFEVRANMEYVVSEPSADWLHRQDTRGMNTQKYRYQVDENTTDESRTATITIQSVDGTIEEVVTITQSVPAKLKVKITCSENALHNHIANVFGANVTSIKKQEDWYVIRFKEGYNVIPKEAFYRSNWILFCEMSGIETIGDSAFSNCHSLTSVTIPDSVTTIEDCAFAGCKGLANITIGNGVTTIGDSAFYGCEGLTSVTIGNGVTMIGNSAFSDCSGLTSVTIPDSVSTIGDSAFYGCEGLKSITIPDGVTTIGDYAFRDCSGLTSVTIGNGVTTIGNYAFRACSGLTSVTIGNSVTTIGYDPFYLCKGLIAFFGKYASNDNRCLIMEGKLICFAPSGLTKYDIPNGVSTIGAGSFVFCSDLKSIIIPESVTTIEYSAFHHCSGLTSITIPDGVSTIGDYAFSGCSGLTSITIPDSVTNIGHETFAYCGLSSVYCFRIVPPIIGTYTFYENPDVVVYVPAQSLASYKIATGWEDLSLRGYYL